MFPPSRAPTLAEGASKFPRPPHPPFATPYYFDAARFVCENQRSKPRYLDIERERQVTRWLLEANDALNQQEKNLKFKSPKKNRIFLRRFHSNESNRNASEWSDNFILADANKKSSSADRNFMLSDGLKKTGSAERNCVISEGSRKSGSAERNFMLSDSSKKSGSSERPTSPPAVEGSFRLREFVERYSLPRVVILEPDEKPVLLYRCFESHTRVEAVQVSGKKGKVVGKPIYIPEGYSGWFSLCSRRGAALATARGTLAAAVRARAPGVVSPRAISAYRASEGGQYEKAAARGGTPLRLAGVFADGGRARATRYAQLLDPHGHELFAPLSTRAELYEACGAELGVGAGARAAAHRLPHLLALAPPPCRARLLAGPVPLEMQDDVGDDLLLRSVVTEPVLVACSLPEGSGRESLRLLPLSGSVRARRSQLGYESERRMFLCSRLQRALAHCQLHADACIRAISYADDQDKPRQHLEPIKFEKERKFTLQGLKIDTSRLFGKSDKVLKDIPDENEGSIIFLSKNELEHMNYEVCSDEEATKCETKNEAENRSEKQFADDKMQVFREDCSHPKRNKWFKHLRLLKSSEKLIEDKVTALENTDNKDPFDPLAEKVSSIERYQDMAKLIEDKFGASRKSDAILDHCHSYKSLTTNSDLGASTAPPSSSGKKPILTKSVSVQTGITDSQFSQDPEPNLKHARKNLSVDQINYCGSMESNTSSGRKLKSLDENMLKKSSATKSTSNLEKRQRIQPDLIPEKGIIKSESFSQIQSCEDINMFGVGSMYNDSDFEINYKQHSFITEKLCSEFHVKTKRVLSKSTSNLLHAKKATDVKKDGENNSNSMPTKTERGLSMNLEKFDKANFRKRQEKSKETFTAINIEEDEQAQNVVNESPDAETNKNQVKLKRSISAIQKRKLPVIEDLPYGQVADAVRIVEEKIDSDTNSDNIYAEICMPPSAASHAFEEEHYDFNNDILANDPIISNVKKEVISRNGERIKQIAEHQSENAFRHIEVVVIEKSSEFQTDNRSINSSEFEEDSRGSINGTSQDSWERERKMISNLDSKVHAIRLEITGNDFPEQKLISSIVDRDEEINISTKDVSLSFSNSIQFNGQYINSESEAVYDTLK